MKLANIQNSQSFRGLNLVKKVNPNDIDIERVIQPCIKQLKTLAKKANITLELSSEMQVFKHFQTPNPVINISVRPLNGANSKMAVQNYSMFLNETNIKNRSLLAIVKNAVSML